MGRYAARVFSYTVQTCFYSNTYSSSLVVDRQCRSYYTEQKMAGIYHTATRRRSAPQNLVRLNGRYILSIELLSRIQDTVVRSRLLVVGCSI